MLIQSKIKDRPLTLITMQDNTRYAFEPNEAGDYVAEVENPKHIERLLSIPEGFCIYNSGEVILAAEAQAALEADDEGADEGEGEPDDDGDDAQYDDDLSPEPLDMPLEHMTLTDLQATFERELGRKPHHRAGPDKLIKDITAHRASQE